MDIAHFFDGERVVLSDLLYLARSPLGFQRALVGALATDPSSDARAQVIRGFELDAPDPHTLRCSLGAALVSVRDGAEVHHGVVCAQGQPYRQLNVSNVPAGTYGAYIRFIYAPGAQQNRPAYNPQPPPAEQSVQTPTRLLADWDLTLSGTPPGPEWLQVGQVTLPSMALVDTRPLYFENRADADFKASWGSAQDRDPNRAAFGIGDLQTFVQAMQTCLEDVKGPGLARWYDTGIAGQNIGFAADATASRTAWGDAGYYSQGDAHLPSLHFGGTRDGLFGYDRDTDTFTWQFGEPAATLMTLGADGLTLRVPLIAQDGITLSSGALQFPDGTTMATAASGSGGSGSGVQNNFEATSFGTAAMPAYGFGGDVPVGWYADALGNLYASIAGYTSLRSTLGQGAAPGRSGWRIDTLLTGGQNALEIYQDAQSTTVPVFYVDGGGALNASSAGLGVLPRNVLDVKGSAAFGMYAGTPGPANGIIVSGDIGIGINTPINALDVSGGAAIGSAFAGLKMAGDGNLLVAGALGVGTAMPDPTQSITSAYGVSVLSGDVALASGSVKLAGSTGQFITASAGTAQAPAFAYGGSSAGQSGLAFDTSGNIILVSAGHPSFSSVQNSDGSVGYTLSANALRNTVLWCISAGLRTPVDVFHVTAGGDVYAAGGLSAGQASFATLALGGAMQRNTLDVGGDAAIGSYAGTQSAPSNGLIVSGAVGIGTASPPAQGLGVLGLFQVSGAGGNLIDAQGSLALGTYAFAQSAPANGAIVSGQVALGTPTAQTGYELTVAGGIYLTSGALVFPDGSVQRTAGGAGGSGGGISAAPGAADQPAFGYIDPAGDVAGLYFDTSGNLYWSTSATERLMLAADGTLTLGGALSAGALSVSGATTLGSTLSVGGLATLSQGATLVGPVDLTGAQVSFGANTPPDRTGQSKRTQFLATLAGSAAAPAFAYTTRNAATSGIYFDDDGQIFLNAAGGSSARVGIGGTFVTSLGVGSASSSHANTLDVGGSAGIAQTLTVAGQTALGTGTPVTGYELTVVGGATFTGQVDLSGSTVNFGNNKPAGNLTQYMADAMGSAAAPAFAYTAQSGQSGLYFDATGSAYVSVAGTQVAQFTATAATLAQALSLPMGLMAQGPIVAAGPVTLGAQTPVSGYTLTVAGGATLSGNVDLTGATINFGNNRFADSTQTFTAPEFLVTQPGTSAAPGFGYLGGEAAAGLSFDRLGNVVFVAGGAAIATTTRPSQDSTGAYGWAVLPQSSKAGVLALSVANSQGPLWGVDGLGYASGPGAVLGQGAVGMRPTNALDVLTGGIALGSYALGAALPGGNIATSGSIAADGALGGGVLAVGTSAAKLSPGTAVVAGGLTAGGLTSTAGLGVAGTSTLGNSVTISQGVLSLADGASRVAIAGAGSASTPAVSIGGSSVYGPTGWYSDAQAGMHASVGNYAALDLVRVLNAQNAPIAQNVQMNLRSAVTAGTVMLALYGSSATTPQFTVDGAGALTAQSISTPAASFQSLSVPVGLGVGTYAGTQAPAGGMSTSGQATFGTTTPAPNSQVTIVGNLVLPTGNVIVQSGNFSVGSTTANQFIAGNIGSASAPNFGFAGSRGYAGFWFDSLGNIYGGVGQHQGLSTTATSTSAQGAYGWRINSALSAGAYVLALYAAPSSTTPFWAVDGAGTMTAAGGLSLGGGLTFGDGSSLNSVSGVQKQPSFTATQPGTATAPAFGYTGGSVGAAGVFFDATGNVHLASGGVDILATTLAAGGASASQGLRINSGAGANSPSLALYTSASATSPFWSVDGAGAQKAQSLTLLGTLSAAGSSTLASATLSGTLSVAGASTLAAVTASGLVSAAGVTLSSGSLTFADGTSLATAPNAGTYTAFTATSLGTPSAPAFTNSTNPTTGAYFTGSGSAAGYNIAIAGSQVGAWAASGLTVTGGLNVSGALSLSGGLSSPSLALTQLTSTNSQGQTTAALTLPGVFGTGANATYPKSGLSSDSVGNLIFSYLGRPILQTQNTGYQSNGAQSPSADFNTAFSSGSYTFTGGSTTLLTINGSGVKIGPSSSSYSYPTVINTYSGTILALTRNINTTVATFDTTGSATLVGTVSAAALTVSASGGKLTFGDGTVQTTAYTGASTGPSSQATYTATSLGTASAPAFTNSTNSSTGAYFTGSGTTPRYALSVAGTNVAAFASTGLVFPSTTYGITFGDGTTMTTAPVASSTPSSTSGTSSGAASVGYSSTDSGTFALTATTGIAKAPNGATFVYIPEAGNITLTGIKWFAYGSAQATVTANIYSLPIGSGGAAGTLVASFASVTVPAAGAGFAQSLATPLALSVTNDYYVSFTASGAITLNGALVVSKPNTATGTAQATQFLTGAGTYAAPGYSFTGQTDTGVLLAASGSSAQLGFSVNATQALLLTGTGAQVSGGLSVAGASSLAAVTASGLLSAAGVTLSSGALTFADGTKQTTAYAGQTGSGGGTTGSGSQAQYIATALGSASAPAFTNSTNSTTGTYFTGSGTAQTYAVAVNGTNSANFTAAGLSLPVSGAPLTFPDQTVQATAYPGPVALAQTTPVFGSFAATTQLQTLTSTYTPLVMAGTTIAYQFIAGANQAFYAAGITVNSDGGSGALTFRLQNITDGTTLYQSGSVAKGTITGTAVAASSATYPMTAGKVYQWQAIGSGTANCCVVPQYYTPSTAPVAVQYWGPSVLNSTVPTTLSGTYTAMLVPGQNEANYYYNANTSFLYGATFYNAGTAAVTFQIAGSPTYTSPSVPAGGSLPVGPFAPSVCSFSAKANYFWKVAGSGTANVAVVMQVVS